MLNAGRFVGLGLLVGIVIGVAIHNYALGIVIGVGIGGGAALLADRRDRG
jgi:hypothetical protein